MIEVLLKLVELLLPELPVVIEPGHGVAHRRCDQAAIPATTVPPTHHQPGALQDPEVFAHGGEGHAKRRRQLADGALLVPQPAQEPAAGGIGQGAEDRIEGSLWVYHVV